MRLIYQSCIRVLIWLGEEEADSYLCFWLVPQLIKAQAKQRMHGGSRQTFEMSGLDSLQYQIPDQTHACYNALQTLLRRPWFHRVWIIQELAVSPKAVVYCGSRSCDWNEFNWAVDYAFNSGLLSMRSSEDFENLIKIEATRRCVMCGEEDNLKLLRLCVRHRSCGATDPRDKVYALLGLSSDAQTRAASLLKLTPDYDSDPQVMYIHLAVEMVRTYNDLEILSVPRVKSQLCLPSWVPDWTVSDSATPLRPWGDDSGEHFHFSASGNSTYSATFSTDVSQLIVEGEVVDQIAAIGPVWNPRPNTQRFSWRQILMNLCNDQNTFTEWERVARVDSEALYLTGERALDAYWKTITASYFPHGKWVDGAYFYIWRKDTVILRLLARLGLLRLGWISEILLVVYLLLKGVVNLVRYWRTLGTQPVSKFSQGMAPAIHRRVIRTRGGYIGLGPRMAAIGDSVVLAKGGRLPLLLRKDNEMWEFIGDCYVHGMMSGESFDETKCRKIQLG
jgi:hypothetical protein